MKVAAFVMRKIKDFFLNFKYLPVETKRLLSIGVILALVLALPLFIWGITTQRFDVRERAASGEPTPVPAEYVNWATQWASFGANNYQIQTPDGTQFGKIFRVNPSKPCNVQTGEMVCVNSNPPGSNPQGLHYMTLEVTWFEYDIEMRMFIYLYSDGAKWWSNEIRVYNGQPQPDSDWVYFYGKFFETNVGQAFTQSQPMVFTGADPKSGDPVQLSFSDVNFQAFQNYFFSSPTPTPNLNPPLCGQSSISPATGPAPLTVTLHGAGYAGNGTGFDGYRWDFEGDGIWDTGIISDAVTHTYFQSGMYRPIYQVHGTNDVWSDNCLYPYQVIVQPSGTPPPTVRPFEIKLKLSGVENDSAELAKVTVRFISKALNYSLGYVTPPIPTNYLDNGIYKLMFGIWSADLPAASDYILILKGEKHLAKRFCLASGQTERCNSSDGNIVLPNSPDKKVVLDFTGMPLEPGDLYSQDGVVDTNDFAKIKALLGKSCSDLSDQDKLVADLDYSGCVNIRDAFLIRKTLETRYDEF